MSLGFNAGFSSAWVKFIKFGAIAKMLRISAAPPNEITGKKPKTRCHNHASLFDFVLSLDIQPFLLIFVLMLLALFYSIYGFIQGLNKTFISRNVALKKNL